MSQDKTYPFVTKAAIAQRLDARESGFVAACMRIMHARHEARLAGKLPHGGWMASQAVAASRLAARFAETNATKAEVAQAAALLRGYVKQLASHMREQALRDDPSLAEAAARYGVGTPAAPAAPAHGSEATPHGRPEQGAPVAGSEAAPPGPDESGQAAAGAQDEQEDEQPRRCWPRSAERPDSAPRRLRAGSASRRRCSRRLCARWSRVELSPKTAWAAG